jgi:hypothetical protein
MGDVSNTQEMLDDSVKIVDPPHKAFDIIDLSNTAAVLMMRTMWQHTVQNQLGTRSCNWAILLKLGLWLQLPAHLLKNLVIGLPGLPIKSAGEDGSRKSPINRI